jgi:hypothetical protein
MKDIQKIKEFFSKPLKENTFKIGDKVTYLGHPAEITKVNKEMTGAITYNVSYDKGNGKTKATNIYNKDGEIKSLNEGNKEYFKPSIRKDKSNPNFLYVDISYPAGSDVLSIGGSKTMGGQDREAGAAKALSMGNMIAKKLQTKYNIEDIDVSDLKDGKVEVFAVSDDFIKMASPSIDGETKSTIPTKMSYYPSALYKEAEEEETAVDMAKKQLDALGIKYEMSGNKFKPFKAIYKPSNEDLDALYDQEYELTRIYQNDKSEENWKKLSQIREKGKQLEKFDEIIYLFNLGSAVKQSMDESLTAGYPHRKTSGEGFEKIVIVEPMDDATRERMIRRFEAEGWDAKPNFGGGITAIKKTTMNESNGFTSGKQMLNIKLRLYPKAVAKINQLIDMIGEDKFTMEMAEWVFDFFNNAHFERPIYEATKDEETEFHKKLDTLVHDTFGKRKGELEEAYVPSNIKDFAKRKGVSSLVNKVAGWAEKVGKSITGGTAIGYNYSTLILDMTYQGSEIRINTDNDAVTLYDEPVRSFGEFQRVYADGEGNNLEERINEALNKINEELCPAGKAYIKRRQAAGEKSSAYLSGRGVKVCKGQMSGKSKKKK